MSNESKKEVQFENNGISDQELCSHVANSVMNFPGIISLDHDSAAKALDILSRDIVVYEGIRLSKKDVEPSLDIYVVVEFGIQIPKLSWELQKQIQSDVKEKTGQDVKEINIHIEGVSNKEHLHEQAKG